MTLGRLYYEFKLMGKKVIWTPILVMVGFALFALLLEYIKTSPARFLSASIEMILPITTGIVVGTIATTDQALELQLTLPRKYHMTGMLRLLLTVIWTMCIALLTTTIIDTLKLSYMLQPPQPLPVFQQVLMRQLVWLTPLLWCVGLGLCISLLLRSRTAAGALLGAIWLLEIIFKDFIASTPLLWPVSLFPTTLVFGPGVTLQRFYDLWFYTRLEVLAGGLILLPLGWLLLRNSEGLLKGSSEE